MQPPAEMVHWLFATGLLLLGLCLVCEGIVGEEVWRMRTLAHLPLARPRLRDGGVDVARDGPLHQLGDPHVRPRLVGRGADARRRCRARARPRQAEVALVASHDAVRVRRHGHCVPRPRAEHVVLRTLRVPAPSARVDVPARGRFPARDGVLAAIARASARRSHSRSSCSPRCSTPTVTWRRSSGICRPPPGCRTDETARLHPHRVPRAALPGCGLGARDAALDVAAVRDRAAETARTRSASTSTRR